MAKTIIVFDTREGLDRWITETAHYVAGVAFKLYTESGYPVEMLLEDVMDSGWLRNVQIFIKKHE